PDTSVGDLTRSVLDLVEAGLGVGAALAKTAAVAVAGGRPVPPTSETQPIPVMIHYSLAAVSELAGFATRTLGVRRAPTAGAGARGGGGQAGRPRVKPGATLRIPLSIENTGDKPMAGLVPAVRGVRRNGADGLNDLPIAAIRFKPGDLSVAPKDFEKLTVFVAVPAQAPCGHYEVILALGPREPDLPLAFEVTAAD
ncbi:MAG: hypothetical protein H0X27_14430, partial [Caulobacteraceae bacterium]|nr:hypothetical protein [Caulobacteraceae bacterium]